MNFLPSRSISLLFALLGALLLPGLSSAQSYPSKPIRLVVPFPAGGPTDIVARPLAILLGENLKQQIVIDNRGGAGGSIGADLVAKSAPDGYTLLMGTVGTNAINGSLYKQLAYDTIKDFTPIALVASAPVVIVVNPATNINTLADLVREAKTKPDSIGFGSAGNGTPGHLTGALFETTAKIKLKHIPYKGSAPAMTDLIGGQIQLFFNNQLGATPYVRSGQLRALGITSPTRSSALPDVATFAEQGFADFKAFVWWGVIGPAGIPKDTVTQINALFNKAISSPEVSTILESLGAQPQGGTPEKFAEFFKAEMTTWAGVIKAADIKLN